MTKKSRKKFSEEQKLKAVAAYIDGTKSAAELAKELETDVQNIYRWKSLHEEEAKGIRINELIEEGNNREQAKRIVQLEAQVEEYQKQLAEKVLILDLLKKHHGIPSLPPESELNGLIDTINRSAQKRKRAKR